MRRDDDFNVEKTIKYLLLSVEMGELSDFSEFEILRLKEDET